MVAVGLVLVVLSGLLAVGVLLSNTDPIVASAFGLTMSNISLGEFFLLGAGSGLVFALGLAAAASGSTRRRAKRRGLKNDVEAERSERELLEEQNTLLREQLQRGGPSSESSTSLSSTTAAPMTSTGPAVADDPHRPTGQQHPADERSSSDFPR